MACQALGRCRICARKHKIAVFGGEEAQHFFIEQAKLKLIILNTVCVGCIGKIERFVKKMDLDMVFNDYIKEEESRDTKSPINISDGDNSVKKNVMVLESQKTTRTQEPNEKAHNSSPSTAMDVDVAPVQSKKNSKEIETSIATSYDSCTFFSDVGKKADAQAQPKCLGDSQSAVSPHHRSTENKIGQETFVTIEPLNQPRRKRPRNDSKIDSAGKEPGRNSSSAVPSSLQTITFVDCGPSDCSSSVKKGGRFLWCDFCKKEFTHAGDLNKHRRKHTGEKPYECNQCQRKFAHASNLARHQRVHSGERPFSCTRCARTFTRRDKLAIHTAAGKCQINTTDNLTQLTSPKKAQT